MLEMPLSIMDGVLFWGHKLTPEAALSTALDYTRRMYDVQGHLTLLWHQYTFDARRRPGWWSVYRQLVLHFAQESAVYVATMAKIATWWRARQQLTLVTDTINGNIYRAVLRAGQAIPEQLRLDVGGAGWRLVKASGVEPIPTSRLDPGHLAAIILPPLAQSQTITLEFEFQPN